MDSFLHSWIRHGRLSLEQQISGCHSISTKENLLQETTFPFIITRTTILGWNTEEKLIQLHKLTQIYKYFEIALSEDLIFTLKVPIAFTRSLALSNKNVLYFLYTYRGVKKTPWFYLLLMAKYLSKRANGTNNSRKRNFFNFFITIFPLFPSISLDRLTDFHTQTWVHNYQQFELLFLQFLMKITSKNYSIFQTQLYSETQNDQYPQTRRYNQQTNAAILPRTSRVFAHIFLLIFYHPQFGEIISPKWEKLLLVMKSCNNHLTTDPFSVLLCTSNDTGWVRHSHMYVDLKMAWRSCKFTHTDRTLIQDIHLLIDITVCKKPPWPSYRFFFVASSSGGYSDTLLHSGDRILHRGPAYSGTFKETISKHRCYNE